MCAWVWNGWNGPRPAVVRSQRYQKLVTWRGVRFASAWWKTDAGGDIQRWTGQGCLIFRNGEGRAESGAACRHGSELAGMLGSGDGNGIKSSARASGRHCVLQFKRLFSPTIDTRNVGYREAKRAAITRCTAMRSVLATQHDQCLAQFKARVQYGRATPPA